MLNELLPMGFRVLATSRPEGVRVPLWARHGAVVLDLLPLSDAQQKEAASKQLEGSPLFKNLMDASTTRKIHDLIFANSVFGSDEERYRLLQLKPLDKFLKAKPWAPTDFVDKTDNKCYDPEMRQRADGDGRFVESLKDVRDLKSQLLTETDKAMQDGKKNLLDQIDELLSEARKEELAGTMNAPERIDVGVKAGELAKKQGVSDMVVKCTERLAAYMKKSFGLIWEDVGAWKPTNGVEVTNQELAKALETKTFFQPRELRGFRLDALTAASYITVGKSHFQPAATRTVWARILRDTDEIYVVAEKCEQVSKTSLTSHVPWPPT